MKRIYLLGAILALFQISYGQDVGVKFGNFDNWQSVLDASKKTNKVIFVDFYATWCIPCKRIDETVFSDGKVGEFMNANFIPIRLQMDRTKNDGQQIRKWYREAAALGAAYYVSSYPTMLFIDSNGKIVNRYNGGPDVGLFMRSAAEAIAPQRKYVDPYFEMMDVLANSKKGRLSNEKLMDAIDLGYSSYQDKIADSLSHLYLAVLRKEGKAKLFSKRTLEFLWSAPVGVEDLLFKVFYPDTARFDAMIGEKGYARIAVLRAIKHSYISDELIRKAKSMQDIPWDSLESVVSSKLGGRYAAEAVLLGKLRWADLHKKSNQDPLFFDYFQKVLNAYGAEPFLVYGNWVRVPARFARAKSSRATIIEAFMAESVFRQEDDLEKIDWAIRWLDYVLAPFVSSPDAFKYYDALNTYANLLYKAGRKEQAIALEEKVIDYAIQAGEVKRIVANYESLLDRMRKGIPTWVPSKKNGQ